VGCEFLVKPQLAGSTSGTTRNSRISRQRRGFAVRLSKKKATTIALDPEADRLPSRAARERGVSRSEFIRQHLALVLEEYRRHPRPSSAGIVCKLRKRGDERELFGTRRGTCRTRASAGRRGCPGGKETKTSPQASAY